MKYYLLFINYYYRMVMDEILKEIKRNLERVKEFGFFGW